ncbi:MAG: cytochrome b [Rhodobacteraceae bacterium]|nr:cytochrome b [Paracoccaceae bacterium]
MASYHPLLVVLHWLLAVLIVGGLIMAGNVLAETPNSDPSKLIALKMHMTMGIVILVLMLIRLALRLVTAKPPKADTGNAALNTGSVLAHWGLYLLVIVMCASGLALANMAGLPAIVFGGSGEALPTDFSAFGPRAAHGILAKLLGLLILAHVAGFLYHQFLRKDGLFGRMWFGNRQG